VDYYLQLSCNSIRYTAILQVGLTADKSQYFFKFQLEFSISGDTDISSTCQ
jgi:hypothetical protein